MEVVAAQPSGHVDRFTDHVQAGQVRGFHRLRRQARGRHAARRHLGGAVAFGPGGRKRPVGERRADISEPRVGLVGEVAGKAQVGREELHQPGGQVARQLGGQRMSPLCLPLGLERVQQPRRADVQHDRLALAPIAAQLQHGGTGQTTVGEKQRLGKGDPVVEGAARRRHTRNRRETVTEGKRHQRRARRHDVMPELPRKVIGQTRRPHLGDRLATRGEHEGLSREGARVRL